MSLNNQLPLSASERAKGSLSDILPALHDLVDAKDVRGLQRSFGAPEQASLQGFRQFVQQAGAVQPPPAQEPQTTPTHEQSSSALNSGALDNGAANTPAGLWAPFPTLNLNSGPGPSPNVAYPGSAKEQAANGRGSSFPNVAELVPYANFFQAQAGLLGGGNGHEIWQRLMQAAPIQQQQQFFAQLAQQSKMSQSLMQPPAPLQFATDVKAHSAEKQDSTARPPPQLLSPAKQGQGSKRNADGVPKAPIIERSMETSKDDSRPSSSEHSHKQHEPSDKLRASEASTGPTKGADISSQFGNRLARTPRQQEQNKQAQQRYRERRKLKVVEMESQVSKTQQQLAELQNVLKQNVALQDKALSLEKRLAEKERECQELSAQAAKSSGSEEEQVGVAPNADSLQDLKMEMQDHIMKLELMIEHHRAGSSGLAVGGVQSLSDAVVQCMKVCRKAQVEGLPTEKLLTRSPAPLSAFSSPNEAERWSQTLQEVQLNSLQRSQLIAWHNSHVQQLQSLHDSRKTGCEKIQKLICGAVSAKGGKGLLAELKAGGYAAAAKHNLKLLRELSLLQDNLQKEAKLEQQYAAVVTTRILTPLQAAVLVVNSWPAFCDCLAFTSALANQEGQQDPALGGGAKLGFGS